jgi:hypothetical protein
MIKIYNFFNNSSTKKYINEKFDYMLTLGISNEGYCRYKHIHDNFDKFETLTPNLNITTKVAYCLNFQYIKETSKYIINDNFFNCKERIYKDLSDNLDVISHNSILYLDINYNYLNKDLILNCIQPYNKDEFFLRNIHRQLYEGKRNLIKKLKDKFYFNLIWQFEKIIIILNNDIENNLFFNPPGEISTEKYKSDMKPLEFGIQYYIDLKNKFIDKIPYIS